MNPGLGDSNVNRKLGIVADDLDDGRVRLTLATDASFHNEVDIVHGGVAMFLLDGAMGRCCCRTLAEGASCATVQLSVQFLARAHGRLEATARLTKRGRSVAFLEAECRREDGELVARAQGTWALLPPRRTPVDADR